VSDLGAETKGNEHHKVYFHTLGTAQSADQLVFETPDHPAWMFGVETTDDGQYLLISVSESTDPVNKLYYVKLGGAAAGAIEREPGSSVYKVVRLVDDFSAEFSYIANDGPLFYFKTNDSAPRYKVISMDLSSADPRASAKEIIPEHPKDVLDSVTTVAGNKLAVVYVRDVAEELSIHLLGTGAKLWDIPLPGFGSVGVSAKRNHFEMFFKFESFLYPGTIYQYKFNEGSDSEGSLSVFRRIELKGFDPERFVSKRVFYPSKDGTQVPLFITHRKDVTPASAAPGPNPCLLYGYGGFSISMTPYFSSFRVALMDNYSAVLAVACLR
jgi:prolyl oligopeptidase